MAAICLGLNVLRTTGGVMVKYILMNGIKEWKFEGITVGYQWRVCLSSGSELYRVICGQWHGNCITIPHLIMG